MARPKTYLSFLRHLERSHIISRSPHPLIPFCIALAFFLLSQIPSPLSSTSLILSIISLIFALIHLIIVKILMDNSVDCSTCLGVIHHGNVKDRVLERTRESPDSRCSGQRGDIITRIHHTS